jgi:3-hydroxypropanoate dehydrogenase
MDDVNPNPEIAASQQAIRDLRGRIEKLDDDGLDLLFRVARTHNGWTDRPVTDDTLRALYDLMKMPPTSANCSPLRILFLRTAEAKARVIPALASGNVKKVETAPVCAVLANDMQFHRHLARLFPHKPEMVDRYSDPKNAEMQVDTMVRNATLQGAYFIMAARALGLDTGALSGFTPAMVNEEFFAGTDLRVNFLCCLGYGDETKVFQRLPRLGFDEVCELL